MHWLFTRVRSISVMWLCVHTVHSGNDSPDTSFVIVTFCIMHLFKSNANYWHFSLREVKDRAYSYKFLYFFFLRNSRKNIIVVIQNYFNTSLFLLHIRGACPKTELLRNSSHHRLRTCIADLFRHKKSFEVFGEVHCLSMV